MCVIIKKLSINNLFRKKMGVIVNKNDDQDELTRRINADLRAKAIETAREEDVDFAEDSEYLKNMKKTGRFSWMWGVLVVLALLALVPIFVL